MIMVIPSWFSLSLNTCWYLSASKFQFKGEAAGVTRCGGTSGLQGRAAQAPRDRTPSFFICEGSLGPGDHAHFGEMQLDNFFMVHG